MEDLEHQMEEIVDLVDADQNGRITCREFNAGLRLTDVQPPIYCSIANFEELPQVLLLVLLLLLSLLLLPPLLLILTLMLY